MSKFQYWHLHTIQTNEPFRKLQN